MAFWLSKHLHIHSCYFPSTEECTSYLIAWLCHKLRITGGFALKPTGRLTLNQREGLRFRS